MKKLIFMVLILSSCATSRRSKPCRQCPQYSWWTKAHLIDYYTMNSFPEITENKIKSNGNEKFNQGDSTTRWIIL